MSLSIIINTCCLGPKAAEITGSSTPTVHAMRKYALETFVLPQYLADPFVREVIIVGEFKEGPDYTYIHSPSVHFSAVDALAQRQLGFEASTGSRLIFQHDDHMIGRDVPRRSLAVNKHVIAPARYWRGQRINNGERDDYMGGHVGIYSREALEDAPWGEVEEVFAWDIAHTQMLRDAGYEIYITDTIRSYDIEVGDFTYGGPRNPYRT